MSKTINYQKHFRFILQAFIGEIFVTSSLVFSRITSSSAALPFPVLIPPSLPPIPAYLSGCPGLAPGSRRPMGLGMLTFGFWRKLDVGLVIKNNLPSPEVHSRLVLMPIVWSKVHSVLHMKTKFLLFHIAVLYFTFSKLPVPQRHPMSFFAWLLLSEFLQFLAIQ